MRKVLILGGSGLVGTAIINEMNSYKELQCYATYSRNSIPMNRDRSFRIGVEDLDGLSSILNTIKPDDVISCLRGDFDKQLAFHTMTAEYLRENGGRLYYFSTANVFDNDMSKPHYEDDSPDSHTDYGQYKLECEKKMVGILGDNACILRLPQVWGTKSPRMKELLDSIQNDRDIIVYPRLFLNTNTNVMIAKQLCHIMNNGLKGIFHLAAGDIVNNKDFYVGLIAGLGYKSARIKENPEEEGCFALLSSRSSEFPDQLRVTNASVISCLIGRQ